MNICQAMLEILDTDEVLIDASGQWQTYYGPIRQQPMISSHQSVMQSTAKSTGTYHPLAPLANGASQAPASQQPMRPMSGPTMTSASRQASLGSCSPASWDNHLESAPQMSPVRRPASAISQPAGRRSADASPLAKKPYAGQYAQGMSQPAAGPQLLGQPPMPAGSTFLAGDSSSLLNDNTDDLSPLAAMERTIIQHEQQMGPPPFDPNSLTSAPARCATSSTGQANPTISQNQPDLSAAATNSIQVPAPTAPPMIQSSPESRPQTLQAFSPISHQVPSPAARIVPASPQQQQRALQTVLADPSPPSQAQQQAVQTTNTSTSTPATPSSSSLLVHGGPETPATPGNSMGQQQCGPSSAPNMGQSAHLASTGASSGGLQSGVDHQPLSNGSASAASITSSSTMTPSGQSLGSVGMGGDSRCGTAPLQGCGSLGLDDLMLPGGSSQPNAGMLQFKQSLQDNLEEKNDILIGKLMMDSNESILREHGSGELAMALEEADWKQQLDRGKSEHLANFLNEPLMKKNQQEHYQNSASSKMLSGGLNPSDDEGNQSHSSSPGHNGDQIDFANYLDADAADNGAGLPPDDSILDLFER